MSKIRNFRKYIIWQDGMSLVNDVYDIIDDLPKEEKYGLKSQMSRCSVSIPANIAEGCGRGSDKEFSRFLKIALGSSYELETLTMIVFNRKMINEERCEALNVKLQKVQKQLATLIGKIDSDLKQK